VQHRSVSGSNGAKPAPPVKAALSNGYTPPPKRRKSTSFKPALSTSGPVAAVAAAPTKGAASPQVIQPKPRDPNSQTTLLSNASGRGSGRADTTPQRRASADSNVGEAGGGGSGSAALFAGGTVAAGLVLALALLGGSSTTLPDNVKDGFLGVGSSMQTNGSLPQWNCPSQSS
jgi:hypothetical protein